MVITIGYNRRIATSMHERALVLRSRVVREIQGSNPIEYHSRGVDMARFKLCHTGRKQGRVPKSRMVQLIFRAGIGM